MLTVLVRTAVEGVGIELASVDAFALGMGPGSYTGLRVATSVVKGLCFALDKPLVAVNTLEAMAVQVRKSLQAARQVLGEDNEVLLVPMIDARRMEVYAAVFDEKGTEIEGTRPVIVDENSFGHLLGQKQVIFLGDGADKCRSVLGKHPNARFWPDVIHPRASEVGDLAYGHFLAGRLEDAVAFEPYYLKAFMTKQKA